GGTEPTVTDANVVLGRLPPDALLGGDMPISADLAHQVIGDRIAAPRGLKVEEAAQGILTILNENLIQAIRVISVEQGFDPRDFTLVAFGGAGPLLASALASELGIKRVVVPPGPGLLCALGLLVADVRSDFSLTRIAGLEDAGSHGINAAFSDVEGQALEWFEREGVESKRRSLRRAIDMRYLGQSHELTVPVQEAAFADSDLSGLLAAFRQEHERVYGYAPDASVQLVTFRVTALTRVAPPPVVGGQATAEDPDAAQPGARQVYFQERQGFVECPVYDRNRVPCGVEIEGPAIFEQMDTTTVVLPGQAASHDDKGNLILTIS
ncbi:MAG: hydantoinase/oxoprolinase family protein, partial [Rhodospirillales bacterium]|nr:hydantoinase/oxoprolinase family protein [Rhodospirillales bacterium]